MVVRKYYHTESITEVHKETLEYLPTFFESKNSGKEIMSLLIKS